LSAGELVHRSVKSLIIRGIAVDRPLPRRANAGSRAAVEARMDARGNAMNKLTLACAVALALAGPALAQSDPNAAPDPYRMVTGWAQLAAGRHFGQTINVKIDPDGKSVWVIERCGAATCADSDLDPIHKFDATGKLVKSFGGGMMVFPHGLFVDPRGNVWATDAGGKGAKGHQVFKFSRDGKLLMTLGKAGVPGDGPDSFNRPSAVLVAPNGDVFVADGHGEGSNARIVKFSAKGKFIKAWGKMGKGPGDFALPHSLAMDKAGRLYVADRENNRIEIFDQNGKFLAEWKQFGRPSGVYIDRNDRIYVADSESNPARNPGFKRGIRIGSIKTMKVTAFIPDPTTDVPQGTQQGNGTAAEGVAVDNSGVVYGAEVTNKDLKRYVRK
jgi:streptogramin lyase